MLPRGLGLEDGEGTERLWSLLNRVAVSTRRGSKRTRKERLHFQIVSFNEDRLTELASTIRSKATIAATEHRDAQAAIRTYAETHNLSEDKVHDLVDEWCEEERRFFENTDPAAEKAARERNTLLFKYVFQVRKIGSLRFVCSFEHFTSERVSLCDTGDQRVEVLADDPQQHQASTRKTMLRLEAETTQSDDFLRTLEKELQIEERWDRDDQAVRDADNQLKHFAWEKALEELQKAVFSRLVEMEKQNQAGTGRSTFTQACSTLLTYWTQATNCGTRSPETSRSGQLG